jgi:hypothetical protein
LALVLGLELALGSGLALVLGLELALGSGLVLVLALALGLGLELTLEQKTAAEKCPRLGCWRE